MIRMIHPFRPSGLSTLYTGRRGFETTSVKHYVAYRTMYSLVVVVLFFFLIFFFLVELHTVFSGPRILVKQILPKILPKPWPKFWPKHLSKIWSTIWSQCGPVGFWPTQQISGQKSSWLTDWVRPNTFRPKIRSTIRPNIQNKTTLGR